MYSSWAVWFCGGVLFTSVTQNVVFLSGRTALQMSRDLSIQLPRPDQNVARSRSKTYPKRIAQTQPAGKSWSPQLITVTLCFLGLGAELEIQLMVYTTATAMQYPSCVCDLHHSSQQRQILKSLSEARDQTHNLMIPSWICFHCATMRTPLFLFLIKVDGVVMRGIFHRSI